jgi:hypothetical protein
VNRYRLLSAMIAAVAIAACATVEPQSTSENKSDKTYVTGSRIPVREGSTSASVKSIDNKQGVDDVMQNRGTITSNPKGGGM